MNEHITLDALLKHAQTKDSFSVPSSWTQGRTVYGGLSAALILEALSTQVASNKSLRALSVSFSAPTLPDQNFRIETELLREGKTIAQWQGRLIQNETVCVQVIAVFGLAIDSELSINDFSVPDIPAIEDALAWPTDTAPGFTQYFEMAQSQGDLPVSGGSSLDLGGWMRIRCPEGLSKDNEPLNERHIVAMIDVWPPATMMQMTELKAGSTVSWTLQFPQPLPEINAAMFLGYQAHIEYASSGYGITHAKIWAPNGELLALSQQTIIVYG